MKLGETLRFRYANILFKMDYSAEGAKMDHRGENAISG
jgi:hypothetical protein